MLQIVAKKVKNSWNTILMHFCFREKKEQKIKEGKKEKQKQNYKW